VLLALDFFPHYRAPVVSELLQSPVHQWVLCGDDHDIWGSGVKTWQIPAGAEFHHTPAVRLPLGFAWMRGTLRLALRGNFDTLVIHANWHLLNTWLLAVLGRLTGKRVVMFTIGWYRRNSAIESLMRRLYLGLGHALALYGPWARQRAIEAGFVPERVAVVYNSLDVAAQRRHLAPIDAASVLRVRAGFFAHPERPMAICTSRLLAKRRLDLVLLAMRRLADDGLPINLLLVGEGPEQAALEAQAKELRLDVHFLGACYDEARLAELIGAASMTVAPGMVGLTAMHSLGYGTPVVTHGDPWRQSPEWEIIEDGVNGSLFAFGDVAGLAAAMRRWSDPPLPTPERRAQCLQAVEQTWNPSHQRRCFDAVAAAS
jgi:glycosyltransferase involved in cell wall biosynthesis